MCETSLVNFDVPVKEYEVFGYQTQYEPNVIRLTVNFSLHYKVFCSQYCYYLTTSEHELNGIVFVHLRCFVECSMYYAAVCTFISLIARCFILYEYRLRVCEVILC